MHGDEATVCQYSLQIYVTTTIVSDFHLTTLLFIISQLPKLAYNRNVGTYNLCTCMHITFI